MSGRVAARLAADGRSLEDAILDRELYFRVSVIGTCNLHCPFCHNEGAPASGRLAPDGIAPVLRAARRTGFRRVQFTGGEPLTHSRLDDFVREARRSFSDVGVTTNGTLLERRLPGLIDAGLTRLHVSLQVESLDEAGYRGRWGIPAWLRPALEAARIGQISLRLNLPVPAEGLGRAARFLRSMGALGCDLKVFAILPEGASDDAIYPIHKLAKIADAENRSRARLGRASRVVVRGFRPPSGIRCSTCLDVDRCKEQSHSLRLGSDWVLRPCLASRRWDERLEIASLDEQLARAALLAIDYVW